MVDGFEFKFFSGSADKGYTGEHVYDIYTIAQTALRSASVRHATSAHNVANLQTEDFRPHRVVSLEREGGGVESRAYRDDTEDQVDLSKEAMEQSRASVQFRSGLSIIRDEAERIGELIDIVA